MKTHGICILTGLLILAASCIKQPTAMFSYEPVVNPEAKEAIEFTNESLDAKAYYWDFGNGQTSEAESPTTVYATPGQYTVSLVAESSFRSDSMVDNIIINPPTVLRLWVYNPDGQPLANGSVELYASQSDAMYGLNILYRQNTNLDGCATFYNLEPQSYFAFFELGVGLQAWILAGSVGPLHLNVINDFYGTAQLSSKKSIDGLSVKIPGPGFTPKAP